MKAKQIFWILAVLMIYSIFSISQGADKFYYGTYGAKTPAQDLPYMSDSLKFNILYSGVDDTTLPLFVENSLRAIVVNSGVYSPCSWARKTHYTLWEPERYPESYYQLTYNGGTLNWDPSASGGKAMLFIPGRDQAGLIQEGPNYRQEQKVPAHPDIILYTAEFRLKSPNYFPAAMGSGPPQKLCSLIVVGNGQVLADLMVYDSDFKNWVGYRSFNIEYYATQNPIDFQIYWFGNRTLYIDYVKAYDGHGQQLIDDPAHEVAEQIKAYVDQDWVHTTLANGDTVVYRWYLRDEPGYIDLFEPCRYIDSLLRVVSSERVGFQAFGHWSLPTLVHEYFLRQNPEEYHVDIYPTGWWGPDSSGEHFQWGVSWLTKSLNESKLEAENRGKDFWVTIQAHYNGSKTNSPETCPYGALWVDNIPYPGWYCYWLKRPPTPKELRLQTFLALCYGANSILNFCYYSYNQYVPAYGDTALMLGLYEHMGDSTTGRWREIRDFTGPRMEILGPVFNQLTWQGACFHDTVGSFVLRNGESSYIDSIVGRNPDSTYVEVGFFKEWGYYDYFMLVNRRCVEGENEVLNVYFNMPDGPYLVTDIFESDHPTGKICGVDPYVVTLQPGEGRLFRLEKYHFVIDVPSEYPTIQSAIDVSNWAITILVAPGTYYENIDFNGRNPTVASYLHSTGDTAYISQTIIDGDSLTAGEDSGSVVRFNSRETSCATLKGFTIRNGTGTIFIHKSKPGKYGGGIYCWDSSPTIVNNIIIENSVTVDGGGIVCRNASPQILNNVIKENTANEDGGGIAIIPYYQEYATPILTNNLIVNNIAGHYGGGIYYWASPFITNNTIDSDSAMLGGGIYVDLPPYDYQGHIENNIITNSPSGSGISGVYGPQVMAYNNVWNNDPLDFDIIYPPGVGNTDWGFNRNDTECDSFYNISQNPGFYDGYHLTDGSPCVDAGDNEAPYLLPTDFEGNPRVVDFVDMGAYEYQGRSGGGGAKIVGGDTTAENKSATGPPKAFEFSQNYPNPFNPVTNVRFTVGSDQPLTHITLKIYNISGQLVKTLVDEEKTPGTYIVTWDGKNNSGNEVASGIYFYQLKSKNFRDTKRMIIIK